LIPRTIFLFAADTHIQENSRAAGIPWTTAEASEKTASREFHMNGISMIRRLFIITKREVWIDRSAKGDGPGID
jgi:hypothetical protein